MEPLILNRVFGFSQQCQMAQPAAAFWMDTVGDRDCYQTAVEENTVAMGSEALEIARAIRSDAQLGKRVLTFDTWNVDEFMRAEMRKVKERIEKRKQIERENAHRPS
jgi:hypothetical protein